MLVNGRDEYRARFEAILRETRNGGDFNSAWEHWFGGDNSVNLEHDFYAHVSSEYKWLLRIRASVRRGGGSAFRERIMDEVEVHLLWARLVPWTKGTLARVQ